MGEKDGGPAFPSLLDEGAKYVEGMSLRDWFAGQALAGGLYDINDPNVMAKHAYAAADAMLNARLISAAPDLLAAAEKVLTGLHERMGDARREGEDIPIFDGIADLSDAINKAKGE